MRIRLKKMGSDIDDEYLMMHIMNNLPSAYDGLMENLEDKLDSALDPLTISVLRDKISEKYERKFVTLYGRVRSMMIDAGIKGRSETKIIGRGSKHVCRLEQHTGEQ